MQRRAAVTRTRGPMLEATGVTQPPAEGGWGEADRGPEKTQEVSQGDWTSVPISRKKSDPFPGAPVPVTPFIL